MLQLLIGLALFLGIHSLQSLATKMRQNGMACWGALAFVAAVIALPVRLLRRLGMGLGPVVKTL